MLECQAITTPSKLNVVFWGPSGAGKTYISLALAHRLGSRVAVLDTEHRASALYAHKFPARIADMKPPFSPDRFVDGIHAAEQAGFDVLIIDSLSPEWDGPGGCLDQVNQAQKSGVKTQKGVYAWKTVTPQHEALLAAINHSPLSIIVTLREKPTLLLDEAGAGSVAKTKPVPRPIMRDRYEYEYDLVLRIDGQHQLTATKSRLDAIRAGVTFKSEAGFLQRVQAVLYHETVSPHVGR